MMVEYLPRSSVPSRILAFIGVLVGFVLSTASSGDAVGVRSNCINSECVVSASSSLTGVVTSAALLVILVVYPQHRQAVDTRSGVGAYRRLGAYILDFFLVLAIVSPLSALPMLLAESQFTGVFQWNFSRDFQRPTDMSFALPAVLGAFVAMFFYFWLHPKYGRQTVGQYVLGYRIVASEGDANPSYGMRAVLAFFGLCMWPVSVILAMADGRGDYWWDTASRTRALRVVGFSDV